MNLVEPLRDAAATFGERPALIFVGPAGDRTVTFAQLDDWSARIAGGLLARGIDRGARVIVLATLTGELYAALIALWRLGAVAVFLDPWSGPGALEEAAAHAEAEALIAGPAVGALRLLSPTLRCIPLVLRPGGGGPLSLTRLAATGPAHEALADVPPEHPALITFTSGSAARSGRTAAQAPVPSARPIIRSHGLLLAQHQVIAAALPQRAGDVDLCAFPVLTLHNLAGGVSTVILPQRPDPGDGAAAHRALAAMVRNGCGSAAAAPAFWQALAEAALVDGSALRLRRIVIGGAVVGAPLLEMLQRAASQADIVAVYGGTEAEPVALIRAAEVLALAGRTAEGAGIPLGPPVPEITLGILDDAGSDLADGRSGEIVVAGSHVARGYRDEAAGADEPAQRPGTDTRRPWHRMGDQGYRDAEGRLWLLGRTHALLAQAGRRIHPVAVEAAVEGLPFVARAALVGVPFLEQREGEDDRLFLVVQRRQDIRAPADWEDQIRRRVAGLVCEPAKARGGDGDGDGDGVGVVARLGPIIDEVLAVGPHEPLPVDARHRSRVDLPRLRRRLIDRHRGRHLRAWLAERFPPLQHGLLIASYFGANALLAQAAIGRAPLVLSWREGAGSLALLCMFFLLRVIDEHKDFDGDVRVHPRRVLSRGLVTLGQLRVLGLAALGLEFGLAWALGRAAVAGCLLVAGASLLIARDFFLPKLLEARMLLNALVHLLIMPLYSLFMFGAVTGRAPWAAPAPVLAYAWVGYAVALAYELARKTRTPQEERPGLVTYSRRLGPYLPAWLALAAITAAAGLSWRAGALMGLGREYHGMVLGLVVLVAVGVLDYRLRPSPARAARLKDYAGLYIFAFDLLLAVALARVYGLAIG